MPSHHTYDAALVHTLETRQSTRNTVEPRASLKDDKNTEILMFHDNDNYKTTLQKDKIKMKNEMTFRMMNQLKTYVLNSIPYIMNIGI